MVFSHAELDIREGQEAAFEAALARGREILSAADGLLSLRFGRCVESPARYLILLGWESVEAHTVGFMGSELIARWRELIGPYLAGPAAVVHLRPLESA